MSDSLLDFDSETTTRRPIIVSVRAPAPPPQAPVTAASPRRSRAWQRAYRMKVEYTVATFITGMFVGALAVLFLNSVFGLFESALDSHVVASAPQPQPAPVFSASADMSEVPPTIATSGVVDPEQAQDAAAARALSIDTGATASQSATAPQTAAPRNRDFRGSLSVVSAPSGAKVFLDNAPAGTTPVLLRNVPIGSRVVRVELDGYGRWSSATRVVANQRSSARATLKPLRD